MGKITVAVAGFFLAAVFVVGQPGTVTVKTGGPASLPCNSNEGDYRFQYWQLNNNQMLGPWNNNNDNEKMKYEVWTGRLIINNVTEKDCGLYRCFSKYINGSQLIASNVELRVSRGNWGDMFGKDEMIISYRIVIGVLIFLMVLLIIAFACFVKYKTPFGGQDSMEGSPDTSDDSKGVYRSTSVELSKPSTSDIPSPPDETLVIETDLTTSFSLVK